MTLEEKLRQLKEATRQRARDQKLERALEYLRRLEQPKPRLPAQRVGESIEQYVDGEVGRNSYGEFFIARQALPFGRPYGKLRIGDISAADLSALNLFLQDAALPEASRLVYLDTETTGLVGGTGTCAFLIGMGGIEGSQFVVRQFFLRDYPEEKAVLGALSDTLDTYDGLITFNGKAFDVPVLEARYALARLKSPFGRLVHFDMLHAARRLWKLRLENCELIRLEREMLGISRKGDVAGWEIPQIYFDYLRTGDARGLQSVFYHNALDIITLAALTVELAQAVEGGAEREAPSLDLFSLSRIFERAGVTDHSVSICQRALAAGLPESVEARALWQLASQYKRQRKHEMAVELWLELTRREMDFAIEAFEELAIYHEHRRRDWEAALALVERAIRLLQQEPTADAMQSSPMRRFAHRLERLRKKSARLNGSTLPLPPA